MCISAHLSSVCIVILGCLYLLVKVHVRTCTCKCMYVDGRLVHIIHVTVSQTFY